MINPVSSIPYVYMMNDMCFLYASICKKVVPQILQDRPAILTIVSSTREGDPFGALNSPKLTSAKILPRLSLVEY